MGSEHLISIDYFGIKSSPTPFTSFIFLFQKTTKNKAFHIPLKTTNIPASTRRDFKADSRAGTSPHNSIRQQTKHQVLPSDLFSLYY